MILDSRARNVAIVNHTVGPARYGSRIIALRLNHRVLNRKILYHTLLAGTPEQRRISGIACRNVKTSQLMVIAVERTREMMIPVIANRSETVAAHINVVLKTEILPFECRRIFHSICIDSIIFRFRHIIHFRRKQKQIVQCLYQERTRLSTLAFKFAYLKFRINDVERHSQAAFRKYP